MDQHPLLKRLVDSNNLEGMVHLMKVFEEIYLFRNGHWQFVQKYIMQNTAYPKATGGTPITSWIPNQIKAVLRAMKVLFDKMKDHQNPNWNQSEWLESYNKKVQLLNKQLKIVSIEAFDPEAVFDLNEKMGYQDF
jgi:indoleamine 2,3-dioxygenase